MCTRARVRCRCFIFCLVRYWCCCSRGLCTLLCTAQSEYASIHTLLRSLCLLLFWVWLPFCASLNWVLVLQIHSCCFSGICVCLYAPGHSRVVNILLLFYVSTPKTKCNEFNWAVQSTLMRFQFSAVCFFSHSLVWYALHYTSHIGHKRLFFSVFYLYLCFLQLDSKESMSTRALACVFINPLCIVNFPSFSNGLIANVFGLVFRR